MKYFSFESSQKVGKSFSLIVMFSNNNRNFFNGLHYRKDGELDRRFKSSKEALGLTNNIGNNGKLLAYGPHLYTVRNNPLERYHRLKFNIQSPLNIGFSKYRTDLPDDINFILITVPKNQSNNNKAEKIAEDLVSCSGFELDRQRAICMEIITDRDLINDIFNHMYDQNDFILKRLFDSSFNGTLNLSNFNRRFNIKLDFNKKGVLDFVLFLCAKHSLQVDRDVRIIEIKNNNLNTLRAFVPSRKIFPNLETIIIEGNSITDNSFIFNKITATGVSIQQSTGGFVKHKIVKPPEPFASPMELPPPVIAADKNSKKPIEILPTEFIANPFLLAFLKQSAEDMSCISGFYEDSAIMSITSEKSTDLIQYQPYTRSLMNGRDNFVQGQEEICEFCLEVFGNSTDFKITKIQANEVVENGYLMVLHGYFEDEQQLTIGFDRTLLIGQDEEAFFISNDQIHLRSFDE